MKLIKVLYFLAFTMPNVVLTRRCSRYPSNTYTPKSPVDENFAITITGNVQTYILGQSYNVSLHAYNGHRFISAKLVLENENGENTFSEDLGHLEVLDSVESRYSQQCPHMIENTNTNPKTKLDAVWIAPMEPGNGCVLIRATILQHRDVWFMDDGGLTKRVCEEVVDNLESQKKDIEQTPCCACDEARYELIFEGIWSRNLHPKNFPTSSWITRFSDILGAAHTSDYRFWEKGVLASPAMQEFAEHGSSLSLEREFNDFFKEGKIRTVIKARGPAFPYLNTPSVASVRVDSQHHQISIASKITPSPDWVVGVSGLELCFANCTWLDEKVVNLYPWDIGTDAGPSYTSPDQPQFPADVIRHMSSEYPPDPRSPFFDETHKAMKPLATLTIRRLRIYERKCEDEESDNLDTTPRECFTHPWTAWSKCTAECGEGRQYSTRVYKQPDIAKMYKCDEIIERRRERECQGENCSGMQTDLSYNSRMLGSDGDNDGDMFEPAMPQIPVRATKTKAECRLTKWSPYSQCNVTCGSGMLERTREYINPYNERECQDTFNHHLKSYKKCQGRNCLGHINETPDNTDDYKGDNYGYTSYSSEQKPGFRSHYNTAKYNTRTRDRTRLSDSSEPDYNNQNLNEEEENEEDEEPEQKHFFQAEDLKQENNEEDVTTNNLNLKSFTTRQAHQGIGSTKNHQMQPNYATESRTPFRAPPPEYCYQPLIISYGCIDPHVVGNFWFYNYCTNECMLFAADICDNNRNKFSSLEQCEENCAIPMRRVAGGRFLQQKQVQGCRGAQPNDRNFKKRRNFVQLLNIKNT